MSCEAKFTPEISLACVWDLITRASSGDFSLQTVQVGANIIGSTAAYVEANGIQIPFGDEAEDEHKLENLVEAIKAELPQLGQTFGESYGREPWRPNPDNVKRLIELAFLIISFLK